MFLFRYFYGCGFLAASVLKLLQGFGQIAGATFTIAGTGLRNFSLFAVIVTRDFFHIISVTGSISPV
jgi:hypothetical protein